MKTSIKMKWNESRNSFFPCSLSLSLDSENSCKVSIEPTKPHIGFPHEPFNLCVCAIYISHTIIYPLPTWATWACMCVHVNEWISVYVWRSVCVCGKTTNKCDQLNWWTFFCFLYSPFPSPAVLPQWFPILLFELITIIRCIYVCIPTTTSIQ